MTKSIAHATRQGIEVSFSQDEMEELIHSVNNRVCVDRIRGSHSTSPWEKIREKLIQSLVESRLGCE